jgi:adenylyltransferase/sulfurtransferase
LDADEGGLNDARLVRYSRHLLLNEAGIEAQQCWLATHVLIIGAGGLGTPAALYLAAAGIGQITIVDGDTVDLTNLQRQILYREKDVDHPKASAAKDALADLNPDVTIAAIDVRVNADALFALVARADVVLDCSDNFTTRHAINRACVAHSKPLVSGAAIRFDGQLSVFDLRELDAPCYACLFPDTASQEEENCATMGVFSPLTGIIGVMQAAEALKCAARLGRSLSGRLLLYDALNASTHTVALARDPSCPVCAQRQA